MYRGKITQTKVFRADRLTQNVTAYLPLPTPNHGLLFP